jgi:hypothetical protein
VLSVTGQRILSPFVGRYFFLLFATEPRVYLRFSRHSKLRRAWYENAVVLSKLESYLETLRQPIQVGEKSKIIESGSG